MPGKSAARGVAKIHKLSSNETPLGPSPKAVEAIRAADHLELYPDGSATQLREAIGAKYGLDPARILCGSGSDELLSLITSAYVGPGDEGIFTAHGFLVYRIAILAAGGDAGGGRRSRTTAPTSTRILAKVTARTKIVFLANPNNPTGTYLPFDEVKRLHAGLPPHVLLVLDAAYAEYVRRNDYASGLELVATAENVVMTRTFSKIYGLADLRLGWMVGPAHVIDAVNRIRGPFNVNGPAMAAGIAAIADDGACRQGGRAQRALARLADARDRGARPRGDAERRQFPPGPLPAGCRARAPRTPMPSSPRRGLILRRVDAYGLPDALRLTVGDEEANRLVVAALRDFLSGAPSHA